MALPEPFTTVRHMLPRHVFAASRPGKSFCAIARGGFRRREKSWPHKSGQADKWIFCLRAAPVPHFPSDWIEIAELTLQIERLLAACASPPHREIKRLNSSDDLAGSHSVPSQHPRDRCQIGAKRPLDCLRYLPQLIDLIGAPGTIRTSDPQIRNHDLSHLGGASGKH